MPVKALSHRQRHPLPEARPSAQARGYCHRWAKLRLAFLQENPVCFVPGCNKAATVADHVEPIAVAPARRLDWNNLRPCCNDHHNVITANFRTTGRNELPAVKAGAA
jgi:5-methylcytosine-specific restriction endonuclease McrA